MDAYSEVRSRVGDRSLDEIDLAKIVREVNIDLHVDVDVDFSLVSSIRSFLERERKCQAVAEALNERLDEGGFLVATDGYGYRPVNRERSVWAANDGSVVRGSVMEIMQRYLVTRRQFEELMERSSAEEIADRLVDFGSYYWKQPDEAI